MTFPLLEKDMNTFVNRPLHSPGRSTKSATQAVSTRKPNQNLYGEGHIQRSQPSRVWQQEADINRMQSKTALHQMQEASTYFGSPAPPPAGPLGFANPNMGVEDMLTHIRRSKLTEGRPLKPVLPFPHQPHNDPADSVCLIGEDSGRIKWIQPSGPRRSGEGTEDEEQGIVSAETTASGGAVVRITLLAAGFIIGPSGSSVREISKQTGADIKSWTGKAASAPGKPNRPVRSFVIEGKRRAVVLALDITCDAVDRYKELCEGAYCGQFVARVQRVRGVDFSYQPPPRNIVPYAAALKGQHPRLSRTEPSVPAAPMKRLPTQPRPPHDSTESMSTTSNDFNSDMMDEDLPPAAPHKTAFQRIHSKADVMKSYLDPHPKSTPHSRPPHHSHHPANTTFSKKLLVHTPANTSAPLSTKHQIFDKHHQSQCSAQPHCAADSVKPINSWLEHCKLGSRQGQATSTPAPASNAPPAGLVEVRPNVWLPSSALQQAQGDFALAVQIAAQGSNTSSDVVSADRGYYNWAADSSSAQFGGKSAQPGLFSDMESLYGSPHASHEQDDSMKQFTTCNMASYSTPRSTTVSPVSATNVNGMFDSAIQQEAMHSAASKHLADNAQQYVFHGTEGNAASAFPFKSPVVGMPFVDPNSFISPQCVLDNNSLFSHQPHSGSEHTPKPDSTGWYAKSAPPFYQPAVGPEQKSALHSSDRISGTAYGKHVPNETWPAYGNYWHSSTAPFSAGQGVDAMPSAHFDQPQMYITSDIAPYSGNTSANVWAGSAVEQAKHSYSHTSRGQPNRISAAHGNVANPQAGFWSPLKMPWVQGSHPLLKGKEHS